MVVITQDKIIGGKITILQAKEGYRVGVDPILLASMVNCQAGRVLDLGAGVGTIGLCLLSRIPNLEVVSLENNQAYYKLSLDNKKLNTFSANYKPTLGDIRGRAEFYNTFSTVVTNPPYYTKDANNSSPNLLKKVANMEGEASLKDFINSSYQYLQAKGKLYMIHKVERLPEILAAAEPNKWGNINLFPICSFKDTIASRIIIIMEKLSKQPFKIAPSIIIHEGLNNNYTKFAKAIIEEGLGYFEIIKQGVTSKC